LQRKISFLESIVIHEYLLNTLVIMYDFLEVEKFLPLRQRVAGPTLTTYVNLTNSVSFAAMWLNGRSLATMSGKTVTHLP
jgi:hypothetical protein